MITEKRKYYDIPYPNHSSKADIKYRLCAVLDNIGINFKSDVKAYKSRLDIVIYNKYNKAECIVKIKNWRRKLEPEEKYTTKRIEKYKKLFGIPVLICGNKEMIDETVNKIINILSNNRQY